MIHPYGLLIAIGSLLAFEMSHWLAKVRKIDFCFFESAYYWLMIGGIVGARLYHVMDYADYYFSRPGEVLALWQGGLGIWGGIVGGVGGFYLYSKVRRRTISKDDWDILLFGVPIAQIVGRLGNAVNGEMYGRISHFGFRHPIFLYEIILLVILMLSMILARKVSGRVAGNYFIGYGLIRLLTDIFRDDGQIFRLGNISVSYLLAIAFILLGWWFTWRKPI